MRVVRLNLTFFAHCSNKYQIHFFMECLTVTVHTAVTLIFNQVFVNSSDMWYRGYWEVPQLFNYLMDGYQASPPDKLIITHLTPCSSPWANMDISSSTSSDVLVLWARAGTWVRPDVNDESRNFLKSEASLLKLLNVALNRRWYLVSVF